MHFPIVNNNPARLEPLKPLDIELYKTEEPECGCCTERMDYIPPAPPIRYRFNPFASMPPNLIPYGHIVTLTGADGKSITQMHPSGTAPKIQHWAHRHCWENWVKERVSSNQEVVCYKCRAPITNPDEIIPERTQFEKIKSLVRQNQPLIIESCAIIALLGVARVFYNQPGLHDQVANTLAGGLARSITALADSIFLYMHSLGEFMSVHPTFIATQTILVPLTLLGFIIDPIENRRRRVFGEIYTRTFGVSRYNALMKVQQLAADLLTIECVVGSGAYTACRMTSTWGGTALMMPFVALISGVSTIRRARAIEKIIADIQPRGIRLAARSEVCRGLAVIISPDSTNLVAQAICYFILDQERFDAVRIAGNEAATETRLALGSLLVISLIFMSSLLLISQLRNFIDVMQEVE